MSHTSRRSRTTAVATAVAVALLTLSCGGGGPSTSTPVTTMPVAPTPTPTPAGGLGNSFNDANCALGKGTPGAGCSRKHEALLSDVEAAMDLLVQQQPQIFDLKDEYDAGTHAYRVLDKEAYMDGLVANLRAAGMCSERDPDDALQETIRVKDSAESSEDYDVLLASGHMRRGTGAYRQTCTPSAFPVERSGDAPPIGSGCGRPYPPPVTRFNCKVHLHGIEYYTLDSTPLVGPDPAYCHSVGFVGQAICAIRPHGAADREACEDWRVGKAKDTGRPGPTWTKVDGSSCTGPESGCQNHPSNQYQLLSYSPGTYRVTAENGATCTVSH